MPAPRYSQVSLENTPYYHCVSRCVHDAFLCGKHSVNAQNYEHRRQWIEERLHELARVFAIELCGYTVLPSHYHVVLYVDRDAATEWSFDEVIERWHQLFFGNPLSQRYKRGEKLDITESSTLDGCVEKWRERLMDISWFMRVLNEGIARQANIEDECTGRFWEGRFKCYALLDEAALIACMAYVDLNSIRAKMAKSSKASARTSVRRRAQKARVAHAPNHPQQQAKGLFPFVGNPRDEMPKGLPFRLTDYLELVELSGRILRGDKRGVIDVQWSPVLEQLNIEPKHWGYLIRNFESRFKSFVDTDIKYKHAC